MASTSVTCESNVWTLVSENNKQGRIRPTLSNPTKYVYDVVPTGDPAPDPTMVSATNTLPFGVVWNFQYRAFVDIYIFAFDYDGRVDFDTDAPYIDTFIQDQHTPAIIAHFNQVLNSTELANSASREDRDIVVDDATGFVIGNYIILFNPTSERFCFAFAINVVGTIITLDTPLDSDFAAGTFVDNTTTEMAVVGSAGSPQVFGLRGTGAPPGVDLEVDITRIIFTCIADSPVQLSLFGNLTALTNGIALRMRNDTWFNVFNVKSNRQLAGIMFDFNVSQAINPAQGEDGFVARLTFAGQDKIGVTERLPIGEDLEFLIQDDLSGLTSFGVIAEGHIVD